MHLTLNKKIKAVFCVAICFVMLSVGLLSGCSTPQYAVEFKDGTKLTTGEYLAYLYNSYLSTIYNAYDYSTGKIDWSQKLKYGEGDDAKEIPVQDYIIQITKDTILRYKAIADKLNELGLKLSEEDEKEFKEYRDSLSNNQFIQLGFNNDAFIKVYKAVSYDESTLFFGLYDKGGKREMSEDEIKKYYQDNIFTYKSITIPLTDEKGSDLDDAGVEKVKKRLQEYLDLFNSEKDFDKVIDKYNKDESDEEEDKEETKKEEDTSKDTDKDEDETDENLRYVDATKDDENLVKAIKSVDVGSAKIVEYKQNGTTNVAALIYRVKPEDTKEYSLEKMRKTIIQSAKYEEFGKEIDKYAEELAKDTKFNNTVLKKCTPKRLEKDLSKNS
ncbi:MAG TPA: hypothetical protein GXX54_01995 [Clostridiales bacterium]|nr:hypothetical protein [Clostridiales bacterium]